MEGFRASYELRLRFGYSERINHSPESVADSIDPRTEIIEPFAVEYHDVPDARSTSGQE
jgi:hypothetical protein